ncbi:MAG: hypothetical protein EAX91_03215 [Candidatus Lokiarchaeota archaeon]|nr:hypothetical protein [Candidatus Lokiarchaeota archaeon]
MKFITGLKGFFKRPLYVFIISAFTLTWILIIITKYIASVLVSVILGLFIIIFGGSLLFFSLFLFFVSFFKQINKMKWWFFLIVYIISLILSLFSNLLFRSIFSPTSDLFFIITLTVNQFFTAFFAFRLCMNSSTKVDDYLYKKEKSRIVTRIIEFLLFGFLNWWIIRITVTFFSYTPTVLLVTVILMLWIMFWINVCLLGVAIIRLIITKEFTAYLTLFFLLTLFYALYILVDYLYGAFFSTESGDPIYIVSSFIIDFLLFLYILGTVYSRVDYIKSKIKFLNVETIALFLIIMKIYVQVSKIVPKIVTLEWQILQAGGLFVIFVFFNLLFGIHSVITHKYKKKNEKES